MVPSGNFAVRPAPVAAKKVAASTSDATVKVTNELRTMQSPLNSRRFTNLVSLPFIICLPQRQSCWVVKVLQHVVLIGRHMMIEDCGSLVKVSRHIAEIVGLIKHKAYATPRRPRGQGAFVSSQLPGAI